MAKTLVWYTKEFQFDSGREDSNSGNATDTSMRFIFIYYSAIGVNHYHYSSAGGMGINKSSTIQPD